MRSACWRRRWRLPFPGNGANLKADTKLQYAGILMEANRFDQAAEMYTQILNDDAGNLSAWMGLVSAHHELNRDNDAIADVEKMPPATYEAALNDAGFLSMLGSIYQQANQFDIAQNLLERSAKLQMAAGGQPSLQLQLQLAAHLSAAQQHRSGLRHLPPGAHRPSRSRGRVERSDRDSPGDQSHQRGAAGDRADSAGGAQATRS